MSRLINILAALGATVIFIILLFFICMIFELASRAIKDIKRDYDIRHRFDRPPIAKCYCIDCEHRKLTFCEKHGIYCVKETGFCSEANPDKAKAR